MRPTPPTATLFPYTTLFRSLRLCSVEETLADLSNLAETLISAAHWICSSALSGEYGVSRKAFGGFTILAMGKLGQGRSEEHTSELQSLRHLVCRLLLEKKKR